MRLFTIGDSISQGFMSGAGARTELSYSTLIAQAMGLKPGKAYPIAHWGEGGMPFDLERLFRRLERAAGPTFNALEWAQIALIVNDQIDRVEDYYERGPGRPSLPYQTGEEFFANISMWGMTVADAWQLTPAICEAMIRESEQGWLDDGLMALPSAPFHRSALSVLNPQRRAKYQNWSALDWLEHHHKSEGVDDVIIWLGANNALGTITRFRVKATNEANSTYDPSHDHVKRMRAGWNLWSPEHFEADFVHLLDRVDAILDKKGKSRDAKVYLGTVPPVTVAPLAKGVGETSFRPDPFDVINGVRQARYFKYFTYVAFDIEDINDVPKLNLEYVYTIDKYVAAYRNIINAAIKNRKAGRYHIVDIADVLLQAAYKRNDGVPTYQWPAFVTSKFPMIDTRYYHATLDGQVEQGGIFSLDGVHPSPIGQGLLAYEFLKVIDGARDTSLTKELDWQAIYNSDDLYSRPLRVMPQLREMARGELGRLLMSILRQS